MVECLVCGRAMRMVTNTHLARHSLSTKEYLDLYPDAQLSCTERNSAIGLAMLGNNYGSLATRRRWSPEEREAIAKRMLGNQNGIGNRSKLGIPNSLEHRAAVSDALLRDYANGTRAPGRVRGYYDPLKPSNRVSHPYRSELELFMMSVLDSHPDVLFWEYESVVINYGSRRSTRPDFLVCREDQMMLVETKGMWLLDAYLKSDKYAAVVDYAAQHGYKFHVLSTQKEIQQWV